jgi:hydroxymethylglutaryl-CoA reductase
MSRKTAVRGKSNPLAKKIDPVHGFSKLSKEAKAEWLCAHFNDPGKAQELLRSYWHQNKDIQRLHDEFIENTITNYYLPFGISPNFLINGKIYCIPMAIEESSVVAAASKSANFWLTRGGFKTRIISTTKVGHVHFAYWGDYEKLLHFFNSSVKQLLFEESSDLTRNMRERGGGIRDIQLISKTDEEPNYYQLLATFETCDSMGANFINSCLERFAQIFRREIGRSELFTEQEKAFQVIMCILSNYTPECLVRAEVSCRVEELEDEKKEYTWADFTDKFEKAVHIARIEPYRAVTHNKGIMNGIDSVVIATGNDFRAVEACAHAYASRDGKYKSLTDVKVENGVFTFWIEVPLSLGTVGGITNLHPMVHFGLDMLGNPGAEELMAIAAVVGLAQNFSALRSLVTSGIQKGHMKMHLLNILNQLEANEEERAAIVKYFEKDTVSYARVVEIFCRLRGVEHLSELTRGQQ